MLSFTCRPVLSSLRWSANIWLPFLCRIFDHGVTFSPIHDMWRETETFIGIVRRMMCDLSLVELGQDLTVTMLSAESVEFEASQLLANNIRVDTLIFPSFSISMGGGDSRRWCTLDTLCKSRNKI